MKLNEESQFVRKPACLGQQLLLVESVQDFLSQAQLRQPRDPEGQTDLKRSAQIQQVRCRVAVKLGAVVVPDPELQLR